MALWIVECVKSGQQQDFIDWQWIFIDDHSTDDTLALLKSLAEADPRIEVFQSLEHGITPALEMGFKKCLGTFITRMDGDDIMPEGRLSKMTSALLQSPKRTIITGVVSYFGEGQISEGYKSYELWLNQINKNGKQWQNIYRECIIASPNWMMRTDELLEIGGFSNLIYPEDYDLVFRWYKEGFQINFIPELTLLWREHALRTSRTSNHYSQKQFFELKIKRFLEIDHGKAPIALWGTGIKARFTAEILDTHNIAFCWMAMNSNNYKEGIQGHEILKFQETLRLTDAIVLLAIYPAQSEKDKMESYLKQEDLKFWYL